MGEIAIKHVRFSASGCPDCEKLHAENARHVGGQLQRKADGKPTDWIIDARP